MKKDEMLRRFMGVVTSVLIAVLVFTLAFVVSSCNPRSEKKQELCAKHQNDSLYVVKTIDEVLNPTFKTVSEVCQYKERSAEEFYTDSLFIHMPNEVFINVATVVYNRDGILTKDAVIDEYIHGKSIYDNLRDKQLPKDTAYKRQTVDTIINGKHFQLVEKGETNVE